VAAFIAVSDFERHDFGGVPPPSPPSSINGPCTNPKSVLPSGAIARPSMPLLATRPVVLRVAPAEGGLDHQVQLDQRDRLGHQHPAPDLGLGPRSRPDTTCGCGQPMVRVGEDGCSVCS